MKSSSACSGHLRNRTMRQDARRSNYLDLSFTELNKESEVVIQRLDTTDEVCVLEIPNTQNITILSTLQSTAYTTACQAREAMRKECLQPKCNISFLTGRKMPPAPKAKVLGSSSAHSTSVVCLSLL